MEPRNSHTFSGGETAMLINIVKEYPALYDSANKSHFDKDVRAKIWQTIEKKINKSIRECKTRWRTLRDTYKRKMKKGGRCLYNWRYSQQMSFLDRQKFPHANSSDDSTYNHEKKIYFSESDTENNTIPKTDEKIPLSNEKLAINTFFKGIVQTVMTFPQLLAIEAKKKIFQIVSDLECEMIKFQETQDLNSSQFSNQLKKNLKSMVDNDAPSEDNFEMEMDDNKSKDDQSDKPVKENSDEINRHGAIKQSNANFNTSGGETDNKTESFNSNTISESSHFIKMEDSVSERQSDNDINENTLATSKDSENHNASGKVVLPNTFQENLDVRRDNTVIKWYDIFNESVTYVLPNALEQNSDVPSECGLFINIATNDNLDTSSEHTVKVE